MCIEKCFALYFPLKTRSICTVHTAKRVSIITGLIFAAFNSQWFFINEARTNSKGEDICIFIHVPDNYRLIYHRFNSVLYSFGPFSIMIIANAAIVYKFTAAKCKIQNNGTESTSQALIKSGIKGTVMLLTVSFMFIILTSPITVGLAAVENLHPLVQTSTSLLGYLNHSINGVLYCIVGSRFRTELIHVLRCGRRNRNPNQSASGQSLTNLTPTVLSKVTSTTL